MSQIEKILFNVLLGTKDNNINFKDICKLLVHLDFNLRIKGSHHIFYRSDVEEILNIQPKKDKAKPYQVKQVRQVILKYRMGDDVNV